MKKKARGIRAIYLEDPQAAERILLGESAIARRKFLSSSAIATMSLLIVSKMVFGKSFPAGIIPAYFDAQDPGMEIPVKSKELIILNDRPMNAETPAHLLDPELTPAALCFVRNNGTPPTDVDVDNWMLSIDGESVLKPKSFSIQDLKKKFKEYSYNITLECGGNGRSEFSPPAKGNQWTTGAVCCGKWTGVRLADVLKDCGIAEDAVYIGYYGADTHLSGDVEKASISRGVPIYKALENESLIAWSLNDGEIPHMNGYPLRMLIGGWPASVSGKWLKRISIRNKVHDGEKMQGQSYRIPKFPVEPGSKVDDADMKIIESMPVKSLITYPRTGAMIMGNRTFQVRGHAWAGDYEVRDVHVSIDFGMTWKKCRLSPPLNRFAWQRWSIELSLPENGYYEVWAKARDSEGRSQPMLVPGWNPKGYLNNACHRIAVKRI